jgi:hypothetical protein
MESLRAQNCNELDVMERRLHDVWLQLPAPNAVGTVSLEGLDERPRLVPLRTLGPIAQLERRKARVALVINYVLVQDLIDDAGIGSLNLARLSFDEESSVLTVVGHVPVQLHLTVQRLDLHAQISDQTVVTGRGWGWRPRST